VRGRCHRLGCRVLVPLTGFLLLLAIPPTGPAQAPGVGALHQRSASLAAESRRAVVELYGLESRLAGARAELARLDAQVADLARRRASARRRYRAAQRTLSTAERLLGVQLRLLYQQDQPDAIAVVLGAASLDEAIDGLETISRTSRATEGVVAQASAARTGAQQARRTLAREGARTLSAREQARATAAELERAGAAKADYLDHLRREQGVTGRQISALEERAARAQEQAARLSRHAPASSAGRPASAEEPQAVASQPAELPAAATPSEPPPAPVESVAGVDGTLPESAPAPPRPGRTMAVQATGYCLRGTTATGLPVGAGIVAVDPAVIPLGTRMTIPGYGEGVAADVGGAIRGTRIDVWFASCAQAGGFTSSVMITFH
jgi:3D (Asp-Asp-Asp) domain-containing protein/peptidoglycan hydrolase CwlO-like protein